jgi:hypothetical protein
MSMKEEPPADLSAAVDEIRFLRVLIAKLMKFSDADMKRLGELELI